jgi:GrpB-like predicted nucleotidyltransferase (UPF0157 family)
MPGPVVIVDYDAAWPRRYEAERARIADALGDLAAGIEHVGSTSVPRCAAKPIIDIMVGIREVREGLRCITPLIGLDYDCVGEFGVPGRLYFRKGSPRSHHVHMVELGCEFWQRHLTFRDVLRSRPKLVAEYSALKRRLAGQYGDDRVGYTEAKSPFIEAVLAQAPGPS